MIRQNRLQERVIERLIELHMINLNRINPEIQNKSLAIYSLQGAAITSAINARKLNNEVGMLGREWRYITEAAYLIEYFDEVNEDNLELKAWFTGDRFPKRKNMKKGEIDSSLRQSKSQLDKHHFESYDQIHKELVDALSQFSHPTYKSTRGNVRQRSKSFDYYHASEDGDPVGLLQLKSIFIVEAIKAMLLAIWTIPVDEQVYLELLEYRSMLSSSLEVKSSLTTNDEYEPRLNQ